MLGEGSATAPKGAESSSDATTGITGADWLPSWHWTSQPALGAGQGWPASLHLLSCALAVPIFS